MMVRIEYEGGRTTLFDTLSFTEGSPFTGANMLTEFELEMREEPEKGLWLTANWHQVCDDWRAGAPADGIPAARRSRGWRFMLASEAELGRARRVLLADSRAAAKMGLQEGEYVVTGNPVRADIAAVPAPAQRFLGRLDAIRLLVLGGSQGAKALNELVPQALALLPADARPQVVHQVGERWLDETRAAYAQTGVSAEVVPFIEDMAAAYAHADWVIARSGALTVAEVATVGLAALFVPFPYAVDDHQTANAQALVDAGAATVVQQADLTPQRLAEIIAAQHERGLLLKQADRARSLSHAQALAKIIQEIETLL